jgi:NDP-sugar pyrophosphorylase family protein
MINGYTLSTIDPAKLVPARAAGGGNDDDNAAHAIAAVQMRNPFGVVSTATDDDTSYVTEFRQKPVMDNIWINAGIYYFRSEFLVICLKPEILRRQFCLCLHGRWH